MGSKGPIIIILLLLASFSVFQLYHPSAPRPRLIAAQPFGSGVHRTYWLTGRASSPGIGWNTTDPGPSLQAKDGDNITLMLKSGDGSTHSWFIDFNGNFALDPNEIPTRSPDFSTSSWVNFTFTAKLGTIIPHGGTFTYLCQQHPGLMYGTFKFNAGPIASFSHSPPTPLAANPVSFDGSASWATTGHTITNYNWNFGDGNTSSSGIIPTITHTYATNKTYTVTLNVTDNFSPPQTAQTTGSVTVKPRPSVPFEYLLTTSPNATIVVGQSATVLVHLTLVKGSTENVTLKTLLSPSDPSIQLSTLNMTSGLPTFTSQFSITTAVSSPARTYKIIIMAQSSTGVDHNATFTLALNPETSSPNYLLYGSLAAIAVVAALAVFLFFTRFRRKRRSETRASASSA